MNLPHLSFSLSPGCRDLRGVRSPPAGGLPLPPPGHSHCPLLQMQVQQRRWRPSAHLKKKKLTHPTQRWGGEPPPRMGHPFTHFLLSVLFLPPALSASFFGPRPRRSWPLWDPSLHLGEVRERSDLAPWPKGGMGSKVMGSQNWERTAVSFVPVTVVVLACVL